MNELNKLLENAGITKEGYFDTPIAQRFGNAITAYMQEVKAGERREPFSSTLDDYADDHQDDPKFNKAFIMAHRANTEFSKSKNKAQFLSKLSQAAAMLDTSGVTNENASDYYNNIKWSFELDDDEIILLKNGKEVGATIPIESWEKMLRSYRTINRNRDRP
jgi:hypothetical protein